MKASFKVREDLAYWASEAGQFESGMVHEVEGKDAVALVAAAEAAGSLVEVEYDSQAASAAEKAVQSQEDGEAALAKAMDSGAWSVGNAAQAELEPESEGIMIGDES